MDAQKSSMRIVSVSDEPFDDRAEAGKLLAAELQNYRDSKPVVLGIPKGGVIIVLEIALNLEAEMDIILGQKLWAPKKRDIVIGSICEDGRAFIIKDIAFGSGADTAYIQQEKARRLGELKNRIKTYREVLPKLALAGRTVIITDDGVETGATMQASLWTLWREKPKKVVLALPVGSAGAIACLSNAADETVCLKSPQKFQAIARYYRRFDRVSDDRLMPIFKRENERRAEKNNQNNHFYAIK